MKKFFWAGILALLSVYNTHSQSLRKAVVNAKELSDHQAVNASFFLQRAPAGWACYEAGEGGGNIGSLNWPKTTGREMIHRAAEESFDIVMHYGSGVSAEPDESYLAATKGCAVFCFLWADNTLHNGPHDYRWPNSPVLGRGPTPAMTVSGGWWDSSAALSSFGAQSEFIDYTQYEYLYAQSFAHSSTAARYAKLRDLHPSWNVFDLRQALRQTCTFYATGWREDGGYGFPQIRNLVGDDDPSGTPALTETTIPQNVSDLEAGPPIQPSAQISGNGSRVTFRWYNFLQTGFLSTVIEVNGLPIYEGTGTSFVWTPTSQITTASFFTKLSDGRPRSRTESYTQVQLTYATPTLAVDSASSVPFLPTSSTFSFSITGQGGSHWNVYQSSDLKNWTVAGAITLPPDGEDGFDDVTVYGVPQRFYKLSNGENCSEIIGFTRFALQPGITLVANQLDASPNTLDGLLKPAIPMGNSLPDGTEVRKLRSDGSGGEDVYTYTGGSWLPNGNATLSPGEAVRINNKSGSQINLVFVGMVRSGSLSRSLLTGFNTISSQVPLSGGISTVLGLVNPFNPSTQSGPMDGDSIQLWTGSVYGPLIQFDSNPDNYAPGQFTGFSDASGNPVPEPQLGLGQGFLLNHQSQATSWNQSFEPCE